MSKPDEMRSARWLVIFFAVFCLSAIARASAPENCPWLNAATASGALGGNVTAQFHHPSSNNSVGICLFAYKAAGGAATLRIEVKSLRDVSHDFASFASKCPAHSEIVNGIGNEAIACSLDKRANRTEQIVGRVRTHAFLVRLHPAAGPAAEWRERIRQVAEAVAGSLF